MSPDRDHVVLPVDRPRGGTRLFLLDGEGVLLSESANELFSLSALGVLVWQGLESGRPPDAIAATAAEAFGLPSADAAGLVNSTIGLLREQGLLAASERPPRPEAPGEPALDARIPPYGTPSIACQRCYSLLGSRIAVRFTDVEQERWVHPLFAHVESDDRRAPDVVIDVVARDGYHFVYRDGEPARLARAIDGLAPVAKEVLWFSAVRRHPYFLYLHAGVVGDGERCLLLPAPSGSGKSSLTAALCHAGFRYFSDEVALIEAGTFRVRSIPLSLCVKDSGWDLIARYRPEIRTLATHRRGDGRVVRYLPAPLSPAVMPDRSYPVSHVIFPRYDPEAATEVRPLPKLQALRRLMDECLAIRARLDPDNVEGLVTWIAGVPTYELPMSSLDRAADVVVNLVRR